MVFLATLHPTPPYNFSLLLDVLARFAYPTLDITRTGAFWRALRVGEGMALVKVTAAEGGHPTLNVELASQIGDVNAPDIVDTLQSILPPHDDRNAFYACAREDERLWGVVSPLLGLPEIRTASVFEALMQTIIEQQIAWVTAQKAQRWLVEWAGNSIRHEGFDYYTFPTPAQIAAATVDDLKPLKITFKRMALMIDLAQQVTAGTLDLEALRHLSPHEAYGRLLAIKGIGHWTAAVTLERAFGYDGWVAHNDVVLQAATNRYFYGGQGRIPPERVVETFARYGAFAGLAARYTMYRWVLEQYPVIAG
jgi:DNA-3-methyladenine glycosylase II